MLVAKGKVLGVTEHNRKSVTTGDTWVERHLHLLDDVRTTEITLSRDFDASMLDRDEFVSVEVSIRVWSSKGGPQHSLTGWRVLDTAGV